MDQKTQFIADYLRECLTRTELCALYGISRNTGYKWIERDLRLGPHGLEERSRTPGRSPHQTPEYIVRAIIEAPPAASCLGCQETARHPWQTPVPLALARPLHRV
jgi:transposase-like protein